MLTKSMLFPDMIMMDSSKLFKIWFYKVLFSLSLENVFSSLIEYKYCFMVNHQNKMPQIKQETMNPIIFLAAFIFIAKETTFTIIINMVATLVIVPLKFVIISIDINRIGTHQNNLINSNRSLSAS